MAERRRQRAGRFLAELMAADARPVLHNREPILLRDFLRNGALAAELALVRDLQQRVPVDRRIIMRRRGLVRRDHGGEIERLARNPAHFGRVDKPIAAHPDAVIRLRQIGQDVAAAIVGGDDLDEAGRQIGGFRDHPDTGLGPMRAGDHAADVVRVDLDRRRRRAAALLRARRRHAGQKQEDRGRRRACTQSARHLVLTLPRTHRLARYPMRCWPLCID